MTISSLSNRQTDWSPHPIASMGPDNKQALDDPYQQALALFSHHIKEQLLNPFVVEEIVEKFREITGRFAWKEGIFAHFERMPLSKETQRYMKEFDEAIQSSTMTEEAISSDIERMCSEVADKNHKDKDAVWEELKVFFQLPEIQQLDCRQMQMIKDLLSMGDYHKLFKQCEKFLGEEALKSIRLRPDNLNLYTLVKRIIKQKPKLQEEIESHWNQPSDFFRNKMICITDLDSHTYLREEIMRCKKNIPDGSMTFYLSNDMQVIIRNLSEVVIVKQDRMTIWNSLAKGEAIVERGLGVQVLELAEDHRLPLTSGSYRVNFENKSLERGTWQALQASSWYQDQVRSEREMPPLTAYEIKLTDQTFAAKQYTFLLFREQFPNRFEKPCLLIQAPQDHQYKRVEARQLDNIYVVKTEEKRTKINRSNINQKIKIKEITDENRIKREYSDEIEDEINKIRQELIQNFGEYLDIIIDNLIDNQLESIDEFVMKKNIAITLRLTELSHKYQNQLNIQLSVEELLRTIVLEANYSRIINKQKNLEIARSMRLIKDALGQIKKIEGKDVAFFIGNTGAGKSTAVGFLLGASFQEDTKHASGRAFHYDLEDHQPADQFPKIGQSLNQSETLYATGYLHPENPQFGLADCPGFYDTRGPEQDLCTNLSLDRAIEKVKAIKSVVVVVSAKDFLSNRMNSIVSLVDTVREKFPFAFTFSQNEHNPRVFVLITKGDLIDHTMLENFQTGTTFVHVSHEVEEALKLHHDRDDSFQTAGLIHQQEIWKALIGMHMEKQIDILDVEDRAQDEEGLLPSERLLKKYLEHPNEVRKDCYAPTMDHPRMREMLNKCIEMSVDTWEQHIFQKFLEISDDLNTIDRDLQELEKWKKEKEKESSKYVLQIDQLKSELLELENVLKRGEIPELFQQRFPGIQVERKQQLQKEIEASLKDMEQSNSQVNEKTEDIKTLCQSLQKSKSELAILHENIAKLTCEGIHEEVLWEAKYNENEEICFRTWKSKRKWKTFWKKTSVFKEALKRGKTDQDFEVTKRTVKANQHTGVINISATIPSDYTLVPVDPEMQRFFQEKIYTGSLALPMSSAPYTARLEGERFTCRYAGLTASGKEIFYSFETRWKQGQPVPWIKISHSVPNENYHEAEIINLQAKARGLEKRIREINTALTFAKEELQAMKRDGEDKKRECERLCQSVDQIQDSHRHIKEHIHAWRDERRQDIERLREKQPKIRDEIDRLTLRLNSKREEKEAKQRGRKHLALVIKTEWESGQMLKELAEMILVEAQNKDEGESAPKDSVVRACKSFLALFHAQADKIYQECHRVLGLPISHDSTSKAKSLPVPRLGSQLHSQEENERKE